MSEQTPEEDKRINHATSGIIAASKGTIKIVQAMKLVGFTAPERKNITVYQRVQRRSQQMHVVSIAQASSRNQVCLRLNLVLAPQKILWSLEFLLLIVAQE